MVKNKSQMAAEYGVCVKTFVKMLKEATMEIKGKIITPLQQEQVYEKLGRPKKDQSIKGNSRIFPNVLDYSR